MPQSLRIQLLSMSKELRAIVRLCKKDFKANLLMINKLLLDIEMYLDQLRTQKLSRELRLTLNRFEKGFKELKIHLFLSADIDTFAEKALTWANILQHRAKLA